MIHAPISLKLSQNLWWYFVSGLHTLLKSVGRWGKDKMTKHAHHLRLSALYTTPVASCFNVLYSIYDLFFIFLISFPFFIWKKKCKQICAWKDMGLSHPATPFCALCNVKNCMFLDKNGSIHYENKKLSANGMFVKLPYPL